MVFSFVISKRSCKSRKIPVHVFDCLSSDMQHGQYACCEWLVKRFDENIHILQPFRIHDIWREIELIAYTSQYQSVSAQHVPTPSRCDII